MDWLELARLAALGLLAGTLGGMVGVGGSIVIIPVLTLLLHRDQHLSQAAAMIVNMFVAIPALVSHHRARAVEWRVIVRMLPFGMVFILLGVEMSNRITGELLRAIFGVFLVYVIIMEAVKLVRRQEQEQDEVQRIGWGRDGFVGGAMGFGAGLLGIGGGPIAVPLLHRVSGLPLRRAIAATTAVMCVTALVGAVCKNLSLQRLGLSAWDSLWVAGCLAPTAMVGAIMGARLTHCLPLAWIRGAFLALISWAALQMLGVM